MRLATATALALVFAGCGGARPAPATAVVSVPNTNPTDRCVLRGPSEHLTVTVEGVPEPLRVDGLTTELVFSSSEGDAAAVLVTQPLRFAGRASLSSSVARLAVDREGPVSASAGARVRALRFEDALIGNVELEGYLDPDMTPRGIWARTALACDELALGGRLHALNPDAALPPPAAPAVIPPRARFLIEDEVTLYAAPGERVVGVLELTLPPDDPRRGVEVVEVRDGHAHVRHAFTHGSVDAWVDEAQLGAVPAPLGTYDDYELAPSLGLCGRGGSFRGYLGPARIVRGTEVSALETGQVWAVVTADFEAVVEARPDSWIEISAMPGLRGTQCGDLHFELAVVRPAGVVPHLR